MEFNELMEMFPSIQAVYKTGSSTLPWIDNPRDTDYIIMVDNSFTVLLRHKLLKYKPKNESWIIKQNKYISKECFAYEYAFLEHICGQDICVPYNIFENKEEYKQTLVKRGYNISLAHTVGGKFWYHVLTGIYMIDNNSIELSEEQIANIRHCHDISLTKNLYNYIQERLSSYLIQGGN